MGQFYLVNIRSVKVKEPVIFVVQIFFFFFFAYSNFVEISPGQSRLGSIFHPH